MPECRLRIKKGDEHPGWFRSTNGVKRGCPLSPGLFIPIMEIAICNIMGTSREPVAFIDELASIAMDDIQVLELLNSAWFDLAEVRLVLNGDETVVQPFGER